MLIRLYRRTICLVLLLVFAALSAGVSQTASPKTDVRAIASAVDRRYNQLRTLRAGFVEEYKGAGYSRTESGTLWLKKPGKMRWEYKQPREKLFVSDGKTAWFYVPGDQQVRKAAVSKLDDLRSPLRYLLGKTRLMKEFRGLSLAPDVIPSAPGNIVLRGVPNNMEDRISLVLLEITPNNEIAGIVVEEQDGSVTQFRFSDQHENVPVADRDFRFTPPPGTEVVEATDIGT